LIYRDIGEVIDGGRKYSVIYADPPWKYMPDIGDRRRTINGVRTKQARSRCSNSSPDAHYGTRRPSEIREMPVGRICADNAVLLMWFVSSLAEEAHAICRAWGFRVANYPFCWVKTGKDGRPVAGQGWTTRMGCELVLLGRRGYMPRKAFDVDQVVMARRRRHSEKPDAVRAGIEELWPGEYRIELFARKVHDGWDAMGDQAVRVRGINAYSEGGAGGRP